jgi:hypothetical protein
MSTRALSSRLWLPFLVGGSLLCSAPARSAAELPFEDGFDTSVFGWVPAIANVSVGWSELDASGSALSGSARVVNQRLDSGSFPVNWVLECFAVSEGTPYTLTGSIRIPTGQATSGIAQLAVSWYASSSCPLAGFLELGRSPDVRMSSDEWVRVEEPSLVAPPGAYGARVGLLLFKSQSTGELVAHFDDVLFAPEPAPLALEIGALAGCLGLWRRRFRGSLGSSRRGAGSGLASQVGPQLIADRFGGAGNRMTADPASRATVGEVLRGFAVPNQELIRCPAANQQPRVG